MTMSQLDLDPQFTQGLRLLHSTNKDSAEQLRLLLDEAIRIKHGPSKMLSNVLHKKYTAEEPVLSDHSSGSSGKKSKGSNSSSKQSSKSSKDSSPVNLPPRDPSPDLLQNDDTFALEILEDDLTCVICKGMDVSARNRLVECVECHSLYHQECHTPHILDTQIDDPRLVWYCANCSKTQQSTKEKGSPKSSGDNKTKEHKKSSSSSSKHLDKHKSTSNNVTQSQSNSGSSTPTNTSAPKLTPNINIVSADRRLRDMMKKAKQEKRSGSGGSSGKHSTSSGSSSKSSQDKSLLYKMKSGSE